MKIATQVREIESGGIASRKDFTIAAGAHIMAVLSGLYKDPIDAMVREYLTNMFDAVQALIRTNPSATIIPSILSLPTSLRQELVFTDNGIGMSRDTVMDVYSQYGNSTKNDSNLEVGGFGLGSKTAFCYNDGSTWTIESRYAGEKHIFMACIGENGVPSLVHVSSTPSKEHSGVTIRIPIRRNDIPACYTAASKYVPYFTHPLTVEGDRNITKTVEYAIRGNTWAIRKRAAAAYSFDPSTWRIVMGNVPYDVQRHELNLRGEEREFHNNNFDLFVPIGSVDIVPSRDSLKMTDRTRKTVTDALKLVIGEVGKLLSDEIALAPTQWDALLAYSKLDIIKGAHDVVKTVTWQGKPVNMSGIGVTLGALRKLDKSALVTQYSVKSTDRSMIEVDKLQKDSDTLSLRLKNTWLIIEDTSKGIQKVRSLLYESLVNKTSNGRTQRYGHTIGHALVIQTKLTPHELSKLFGGFPENEVMKVSDLRGGKLPAGMKSSVDTIYRWNGTSWDARVNIPAVAGQTYFYLPLAKGQTNRFVWKEAVTNYSPQDMTRNIIEFARNLGMDVAVGNLYGVKEDEVKDIDTTVFIDLHDGIQTKVLSDCAKRLRHWAVGRDYPNNKSHPMENVLRSLLTSVGLPKSDPTFQELLVCMNERLAVTSDAQYRMIHSELFWTPATKAKVKTMVQAETATLKDVNKMINDLFVKYPMFGMIVGLIGGQSYNMDAYMKKYKSTLLDFFKAVC